MSDLRIDDIFLYLLLFVVFCYFMKEFKFKNNIEGLEGGYCGYPGTPGGHFPKDDKEVKDMMMAMATDTSLCFPASFGANSAKYIEICNKSPFSKECLVPTDPLTPEEVKRVCQNMCSEVDENVLDECVRSCQESAGDRKLCSRVDTQCSMSPGLTQKRPKSDCVKTLSVGTTSTTPCKWIPP